MCVSRPLREEPFFCSSTLCFKEKHIFAVTAQPKIRWLPIEVPQKRNTVYFMWTNPKCELRQYPERCGHKRNESRGYFKINKINACWFKKCEQKVLILRFVRLTYFSLSSGREESPQVEPFWSLVVIKKIQINSSGRKAQLCLCVTLGLLFKPSKYQFYHQ